MRRRTAGVLAGTAAMALTATVTVTSAGASYGSGGNHHKSGVQAIGLTTDQRLVSFDVRKPERPKSIGRVSGLVGDTRLVGIDYRVQDGNLYGVGDAGGIYTLSTGSGVATKVAQLTVPLSGTSFGVDFNPAANALRVVSDTGQNLRYAFATGATTADGTLTYPPATTPATGITGAAYTNNDLDASTATTLFDLDTAMDQVAIQSPANSGQLVGTGKLGVDSEGDSGFDIFSDLVDGRTEKVQGFATLRVDGAYRLYTVSLLSGDADELGRFPTGTQVSDLAVRLDTNRR